MGFDFGVAGAHGEESLYGEGLYGGDGPGAGFFSVDFGFCDSQEGAERGLGEPEFEASGFELGGGHF